MPGSGMPTGNGGEHHGAPAKLRITRGATPKSEVATITFTTIGNEAGSRVSAQATFGRIHVQE